MKDGFSLEDALANEMISSGAMAHRIAQSHHLDPGSNGFTFGSDRYHRATELVSSSLRDHGFRVYRKGAGLRAERDGTELQFATARGTNLNDRSKFDIDGSPSRRAAGASNVSLQEPIQGFPEMDLLRTIHVIWSGDLESGQTAVHIGKLVKISAQSLAWEDLVRLDQTGSIVAARPVDSDSIPALTYQDQPLPTFTLDLVLDAKADEV